MIPARGFSAGAATSPLAPFNFERRDVGETDVRIDILYCGICHTDLHQARNDWGGTVYPIVPGHEIVGKVAEVGGKVVDFKPGDIVGVGCMVDSCRTCAACAEGLEQYCENGFTPTYNGPDEKSGGTTYGGYSDTVVVDEAFVLRMPGNIDLKGAAPLLCAGITTYSPLRHWKVGPGQKVGIVGLGGLGHMAVKFAHAMGAHVVMITTSPEKGADAKRLGADEVLVSKDADTMAAQAGSFDFILNTIPVSHDLTPYTALLKRDATMVIVGAITPIEAVGGGLIRGRKAVAGSLIGGIPETQEMLDFCGEHGISSDVEVIAMNDVNTAYERMLKSDVKYRFVIDMATL